MSQNQKNHQKEKRNPNHPPTETKNSIEEKNSTPPVEKQKSKNHHFYHQKQKPKHFSEVDSDHQKDLRTYEKPKNNSSAPVENTKIPVPVSHTFVPESLSSFDAELQKHHAIASGYALPNSEATENTPHSAICFYCQRGLKDFKQAIQIQESFYHFECAIRRVKDYILKNHNINPKEIVVTYIGSGTFSVYQDTFSSQKDLNRQKPYQKKKKIPQPQPTLIEKVVLSKIHELGPPGLEPGTA